MQKTFLLLVILFIAAFLRLFLLDKIPNSINGDELHYLLDTKSFFFTGKDTLQTASIFDTLLFRYSPYGTVGAELQYYLEMPLLGPLPFSLFLIYLPNAILGIITVFLSYIISKKLFNTHVALFSGFFAAVNPWYIFISRTSYEMIPAVCFYLCSFYVLLVAKGWKILLAIPFLILTFYSDIAAKPIMLPLTLALVFYCYFFTNKRKFALQYSILIALLSIFVLFYFIQIKNAPATSRLSEILLPNSQIVSQQVDSLRKTSINNALLPFFDNKISIFFTILTGNMFSLFSPDYLFVHGDYFASLGQYGLFYPLDLLFLIIGGVWLFLHNKKLFILFCIFIFFSIIPQIIHTSNKNFTPHINLLFPFFIMIMAVGAWQLFKLLNDKKLYIFTIIISVVYLFSIGSFIHTYFFNMPLQHNFFNFPDRVLSRYISLSKQHQQTTLIYTPNPKEKFKEYILYSNSYTKNNSQLIAASLLHEQYTSDSVRFLSCDRKITTVNKNDVIITNFLCHMHLQYPHLSLPELSDNGTVFEIYNDTICKKYSLHGYISHFNISDFAVEKLPQKIFCTKFISLQ